MVTFANNLVFLSPAQQCSVWALCITRIDRAWYAVRPIALNFAWTERHCHACKTPRSMYPSIYNSFPVIRTTIAKNRHFYIPWPSFFVCPGDAPVAITQNVAWMKTQFSACQTPRSMYASIFNSFPVIRTASANNRRFHVPQSTFLFSLETLLRLSRNMLHGWKDNSMLAKSLVCTYLSSIVSELYDA